MLLKLLIAGDGGQGIQTIADLISQAAFHKDFSISHVPNYGLEQRGGASLAFIQIGDKDVTYPKFKNPDILLIMSDEARKRILDFIPQSKKVIDIKDYLTILSQNNIPMNGCNIFFLGILVRVLEENKIDIKNEIFSLLEKKLGSKPNWEINKKNWELGLSHNS